MAAGWRYFVQIVQGIGKSIDNMLERRSEGVAG